MHWKPQDKSLHALRMLMQHADFKQPAVFSYTMATSMSDVYAAKMILLQACELYMQAGHTAMLVPSSIRNI